MIGHAHDHGPVAAGLGSPEAARLMRRASYASVATAFVLIFVKLFAVVATGSVSLLSTLLDSFLDAAASIVNLVTVRQSLVPPDREHRFGHGKAEPIGGLAQAMLITGSGLFLFWEAGQRFVDPRPVENTGLGIWVMVFSAALSIGLVTYQRAVIARTRSVAIKADSLHYVTDIVINLVVLVSLALTAATGALWIDPLFAVAVGIYILTSAWRIGREMLDMLMDREMPDEDRGRIRDLALAHPEVRAVNDLRTRLSGQSRFIQFNLEMDGAMSLHDAHDVTEAVEAEILTAFPAAEILIHLYPTGAGESHRFAPR